MGCCGVFFSFSLLVAFFAVFLTLPAFRQQRDTLVDLLSTCPLHWINGHMRASREPSIIVRTGKDLLLSQEELKSYDGTGLSKELYVAILGSVYDVSSGRKHYGPGGSYSFFSGKDATRAFVTGDFTESGLVTDVSDLTSSQWLDLLHWFNFYDNKYHYVGKVVGTFYDENGVPSSVLLAAQTSVDSALATKALDDAQQRVFPPCNSHWSEASGATVWCSPKSGGIERDWEGVPRKFFDVSTQQTRCVCVRTSGPPSDKTLPDLERGDLDHPSLHEYVGCPPESNTCAVHQ